MSLYIILPLLLFLILKRGVWGEKHRRRLAIRSRRNSTRILAAFSASGSGNAGEHCTRLSDLRAYPKLQPGRRNVKFTWSTEAVYWTAWKRRRRSGLTTPQSRK